MTRGLSQELGPNYSPAGRERGEKSPPHPTLYFCSRLPLANPSQRQRARKPGSAACRGQLSRARSGSWEQMENNQHTHIILEEEYYIPILQLDKLRPRGPRR